MKGPTIWRLSDGRARRTSISPRSTARGTISISMASALARSPGGIRAGAPAQFVLRSMLGVHLVSLWGFWQGLGHGRLSAAYIDRLAQKKCGESAFAWDQGL